MSKYSPLPRGNASIAGLEISDNTSDKSRYLAVVQLGTLEAIQSIAGSSHQPTNHTIQAEHRME